MAQVTIHVPPRPYQARIENGLFTRAGALLAELLPQSTVGSQTAALVKGQRIQATGLTNAERRARQAFGDG
jgi:hypothetical protein